MTFPHKHILELEGMPRLSMEQILDTAQSMKEILGRTIKKVPTLRGRTVLTLFYEASTRTRASFELAAKYMSADTFSVATATSSVKKGETLLDTTRTLEVMGADLIVIRHGASGAPHFLAGHVDAPVINAGDGTHEHPSQGLLDMFTIREKKGPLDGLRVSIVGDVLHSRVARSNMWGLTAMGADVTVCGPDTLLPEDASRFGVRVTTRTDEAVTGADVIMVLRLQLERQQRGLFPSTREYSKYWGIDRRRLGLAKPDVMLMHPGPMNRGVEITSDIADGSESVINEQVTNGVAVRMALLYLLLGVGGDNSE